MAEEATQSSPVQQNTIDKSGVGAGLATAAVVGIGAALIEVEWIPGVLLGVAAMAFPKLVPAVGRGVRPLVRSAIKAGYTASNRAREWMAEAGEQMNDMVAEVRAASVDGNPSSTGTTANSNGASAPTSETNASGGTTEPSTGAAA